MRKIFASVIFIIVTFNTIAQNWALSGISIPDFETRCIYEDTTNHYLYVAGAIGSISNDFIIYRYNGISWDTLGAFNDQILSIIVYNGELIAGGFFNSINGQPDSGIARYDGVSWHPFGNFNAGNYSGTILNFRIINGELYACGEFSRVDSINANSIAKWNGIQWSDVYNFPPIAWQLNDVVIYNNDLYVGGNWDSLTRSLMMYKNGSWQQVGQGITGSNADIWKMIVYNNELYIGGCIMRNQGNVGNGIQKWNGTTWTQVGTCLQDANDSYNSFLQVEDMKIHNNELYVCGTFYYAGNVPAKALAKWDGTRWCGFGTNDFTYFASALGFYHDTLFLGYGYDTLDGVYVDHLIKWTAGSYVDTCSAPAGIQEPSNEYLQVLVYPNPANSTINIQLPSVINNEELFIIDVLGNTVYHQKLNNMTTNIDVSQLSNGVYFYQLTNNKETVRGKFVKE